MSRRHAIAIAALAAISCGATAHAQHGDHAQQHGQDHGHRNDGGSTGTGHGQHQAAHDAHHQGPSCTPEHAAMGHCTLSTRAPRTPVPEPTDADRAAAFPVLAHHSMEHPSPVTWQLEIDRLEARDADPGTGQLWEAEASVGGDVHGLLLKSEGSRSGGRTDSAELELLYGRAVTPWWDVLAGVRHETRPGSRSWAALGVEGTAPGMIDVTAMAYVGSGGRLQLKLEAGYDLRFSDRLILQPLLEATASLEDEPDHGTGSGLNGIEAGLRLRYEITPRFAPYVGIAHERLFGGTADLARTAGEPARDTHVVAGVRGWW